MTDEKALLAAVPPHLRPMAQFLLAWEGVKRDAYQDAGGLWTIGVGHRLEQSGDPSVCRWPVSTIAGALSDDMGAARQRVADALTDEWDGTGPGHGWGDLSAGQKDALSALAFNVGSLHNTKLVELIHDGAELQAIVAEWVSWDHAGKRELRGLLRRRLAEASMYVDASG